MKQLSEGGRNALRGFWYQVLYSALRTTYVDIANYSIEDREIYAKFVFEGRLETDVIVSYPNLTEYIQIKSRRTSDPKWRIHELVSIYAKMLVEYDGSKNSVYTFITDGILDNNCIQFNEVCRIVNKLKTLKTTDEDLIAELRNKDFNFKSRSTIFSPNGLQGNIDKLLEYLKSALKILNNHILFDALSRINIVENYSESNILESIWKFLGYYLPQEKIKPVTNQLIAEILKIAQESPVKISRERLFERVGIPTIPIVIFILKRACSALTLSQASHNRGFITKGGVRRPQLEDVFHAFMQAQNDAFFLLTGHSGVGKTIASLQLALHYGNILPTIYTAAERFRFKDPIEEISRSLSLELGRSDVLPIKTIIGKIDAKRIPILLIIDGIDSLDPERFQQILISLHEYFYKTNVKMVYTCKSETLDGYRNIFQSIRPSIWKNKDATTDNNIASFELGDYNIHEFMDALRCYGHKVSKHDDEGNVNLYDRNVHLHKPLYLSTFSEMSKDKTNQYPPSLGMSIVFEIYLQNLVSMAAKHFPEYPAKIMERLTWDTLVIIAKLSNRGTGGSAAEIVRLVKKKHRDLDAKVYPVISRLCNLGLLYEDSIGLAGNLGNVGLISALNENVIKLFHEEIREWVLAFDNASNFLKRGKGWIYETIGEGINKREAFLALGIVFRTNNALYNEMIVDLLSNMQSVFAAKDLMSNLQTPDKALLKKFIKQLHANNQNCSEILFQLQILYFNRGLESNAIGLFSAAIDAFNANLEIIDHIENKLTSYNRSKSTILNNLAVSYRGLNKIEKAIALYHQSVELDPNWYSYTNLAFVQWTRGNYVDAIPLFDKALSFKSEVRKGQILQTMSSRACCLFRIGKIKEACSVWEEILSQREILCYLHEHAVCQYYSNLGDGMFRLGNYSRAIECFQKAIALDPIFEFDVSRGASIYMIASYLREGKLAEAERYLNRYGHVIDMKILEDTVTRYNLSEYRQYFQKKLEDGTEEMLSGQR